MKRNFIYRYLILLVVLILCAGLVWYLSRMTDLPAEDAVLARADGVCWLGGQI